MIVTVSILYPIQINANTRRELALVWLTRMGSPFANFHTRSQHPGDGWLALAISQAGAYLQRTSALIQEYLSRLAEEKERWQVLKATEFDWYRQPNSTQQHFGDVEHPRKRI